MLNAYGPRTTFAPGFNDLFGGVAKPYKKVKPPVPEDTILKDIFTFLRANPMSAAHEIAVGINATRDRTYLKLKVLYRMKHLSYKYESLSATEPRKYKKWFVIEEKDDA